VSEQGSNADALMSDVPGLRAMAQLLPSKVDALFDLTIIFLMKRTTSHPNYHGKPEF